MSDEESLSSAIEMIAYLTDLTAEMNCKIGMYNHDGWFGNPDNLVKIAESIPEKEVNVFLKFHHARHLLEDFSARVNTMLPYLWVVNLNGMNPNGPKILEIGKGTKEVQMIQVFKDDGYKGPWRVLGYRIYADVK